MKNTLLYAAAKNLRDSFWLLVSSAAVCCLFLAPSVLSAALVCVCFGAVLVCLALGFAALPPTSSWLRRAGGWVLALQLLFVGYRRFTVLWAAFGKIHVLGSLLGLSVPILLSIIALIGSVVGFYAMDVLCRWILVLTDRLGVSGWVWRMVQPRLSQTDESKMLENLKRNWALPASGLAFFCLNATTARGYWGSVQIAFLAIVFLSTQIGSIWDFLKTNTVGVHILSALTSAGVCLCTLAPFRNWLKYTIELSDEQLRPILAVIHPGIAGTAVSLLSLFFVYFCVLVFWKAFIHMLSDSGVFRGITKIEWVVYGLLAVVTIGWMAVAFSQTAAFYGTEHHYDLIYTSDSPTLVKRGAYLVLALSENDLRQPLFAAFAAPFTGTAYLLGKIPGVPVWLQAVLLNAPQIFMLYCAHLMLAKMMGLNPVKRVCFLLVSSCTYTHLLFTLMMEQYIVAYFWLILCIYCIAENRQPRRMALWGAGGTLLTSMVLLPFMSQHHPIRDFKRWFGDMMKYGLEFAALMLALCRFDVIYNFFRKASTLSGYTGKNVTAQDKFYQFSHFLHNCFLPPETEIGVSVFETSSWMQSPVTDIQIVGIGILVLAVISAIWNRNKLSNLAAAGWFGFCAVMLLVLGWGTTENGLILYALYFGWSLLVLLFQLVDKISRGLRMPFLVPLVSIGCAVGLLAMNFPAIQEMIAFAITYYPI